MNNTIGLLKEELKLLKASVMALEVRIENELTKGFRLGDMAVGETFNLCDHEFIVLKHENGNTHVISEDFWKKNVKFGDTTDYKTSNLRTIMESEILPNIANAVGADNIVEHEVNLISVDMQKDRGTLHCKVRPITFDEAREFNDLIVNEGLSDWWWTCTLWSNEKRGWKYSVAVVAPRGYVACYNCDNGHGVRPFCILKSDIFVSKKGD